MGRKIRRGSRAPMQGKRRFHMQRAGSSRYRQRLQRRGQTNVSVRMTPLDVLRKRQMGGEYDV